MSTRVLVVEDDPQMAELLDFILETEGYVVGLVGDGVEALEALSEDDYSLVVLDLMIPRLDGLEVCRRVRESSSVPVLILTARTEQSEVLRGLEAGADDYLGKPFHPRELTLRVNAILRRHRGGLRQGLRVGDLYLDFGVHRATLATRVIDLSALEWRILKLLAEEHGAVVEWDRMLEEAWSVGEWAGGREMVKAAVYRLRQRLHDDAASPRYVETVRGVGYRLLT